MALSPELKSSIALRAASVADDQRSDRILSELKSDLSEVIGDVEYWTNELSQLKPVTESVLSSVMVLRTDLHDLWDRLDADAVDGGEMETFRALKRRYEALKPLVEAERQRDVGPM